MTWRFLSFKNQLMLICTFQSLVLMTWWSSDNPTRGLSLLPVLAVQAQTCQHVWSLCNWRPNSPSGGINNNRNHASNLWHYANTGGAHALSWLSSMSAPPPEERRGGSRCLSGCNNNKVKWRLAAPRSSHASETEASARAADLVLFNEM